MNNEKLNEAIEDVKMESAYQGFKDNKIHHHFVLTASDYTNLKEILKAAKTYHDLPEKLEAMKDMTSPSKYSGPYNKALENVITEIIGSEGDDGK